MFLLVVIDPPKKISKFKIIISHIDEFINSFYFFGKNGLQIGGCDDKIYSRNVKGGENFAL